MLSTDAYEAVAEAAEAELAELPALLSALVQVPSVSGSPEEDAAQHWLAERFRGADLDTDLWPLDLPALTASGSFPGWEVPRERAHGLVGRLPGRAPGGSAAGGAPSLLLLGHVDVVPPGDLESWTDDPFAGRVTGDRLTGRGACDMKAGLVAAFLAVRALARSRVPLLGDVAVASVVGEEDGGLGTYALLARGHTADGCVITEPTDLDVVPANAGALTFRLLVPGLAAHGSRRTEGVSAVEALVPLLTVLRDLETRRSGDVEPLMAGWDVPYPISIGVVRAGDWASTVPDLLVAEGRYGVRLGEPVAQARAVFEEAVADACAADPWLAEHPARVEWWGGQFASGRTSPDDPLVGAVLAAHAAVGPSTRGASVHGAPYGSDLRLLTGAGIPTVQYGPGHVDQAHTPDEWVPLDEVAHVTRACARLAVERCGVDGPA